MIARRAAPSIDEPARLRVVRWLSRGHGVVASMFVVIFLQYLRLRVVRFGHVSVIARRAAPSIEVFPRLRVVSCGHDAVIARMAAPSIDESSRLRVLRFLSEGHGVMVSMFFVIFMQSLRLRVVR